MGRRAISVLVLPFISVAFSASPRAVVPSFAIFVTMLEPIRIVVSLLGKSTVLVLVLVALSTPLVHLMVVVAASICGLPLASPALQLVSWVTSRVTQITTPATIPHVRVVAQRLIRFFTWRVIP